MPKRQQRKDKIGKYVAPSPRFWAGVLALPGYLLIQEILWKAALVLFFALLAIAAGKRIQWFYFFIFTISVTFFHLLNPVGKVLIEIGPFIVTEGAFLNGISRSLNLSGMVFLSLVAVKPGLRLPGGFGGLLARTFQNFERLLEKKGRLKWNSLVNSLDDLLLECFTETAQIDPEEYQTGRGTTGIFYALLVGTLPWIIFGLVHIDFLPE